MSIIKPLPKELFLDIKKTLESIFNLPITKLDGVVVDFGEKPNWFTIIVDNDTQRNTLIKKDELVCDSITKTGQLHSISFDSKKIQVNYYSQETTDRDFEGNWFYAMR